MPLSSILYSMPYRLFWKIHKARKKLIPLVAYCAEPLDYHVLEPVVRHLNASCVYVAKNSGAEQYLGFMGIKAKRMPVFPRVVLMARHSIWKFPVKDILKFGFRHGPYHFKTFTANRHYLAFTLFFVTSEYEAEYLNKAGITNTHAIGYPKLDDAFNLNRIHHAEGEESELDKFYQEKGIDRNKPVLMFSATYEQSGMSAVHLWSHRLHELTSDYNVLVTLHPWISRDVYEQVANTPGVHLITVSEHIPAILASDLTISDTSSIIGEFIALDKRIITFRTREARRKPETLDRMLDKAGNRVDSFNELKTFLPVYLTEEDPYLHNRRELRDLMFSNLGTAGEEAAKIINKYL